MSPQPRMTGGMSPTPEPMKPDEQAFVLQHKVKFAEKTPETKATVSRHGAASSWSSTLLLALVVAILWVFWSLPAPTFHGKLTVARQLMKVSEVLNQIDESRTLRVELKNSQKTIAELQQQLADSKSTVHGMLAEVETLRHRVEASESEDRGLTDKLGKARRDDQREQKVAEDEVRLEKKSEKALIDLRKDIKDRDSAVGKLRGVEVRLKKEVETQKSRGSRLVSKLKRLRDAELPLLKSIDGDLQDSS